MAVMMERRNDSPLFSLFFSRFLPWGKVKKCSRHLLFFFFFVLWTRPMGSKKRILSFPFFLEIFSLCVASIPPFFSA